MTPGEFSKLAKEAASAAASPAPVGMNSVQRSNEQQALQLLKQGYLNEAEVIYRTLMNEGIRNWAIFGNLAHICGMQGRTKEMISFYRQALAINPNLPDALSNLGIALHNKGDITAAVDAFRRALAIQPNSPGTLCALGNALQSQGHGQDAVDAYRQALAINSNIPELHANLGHALLESGAIEAAITAYRQALAVTSDPSPACIATLLNLGYALWRQGDLQAAGDAYRRVLTIDPNSSLALSNMGNVLLDQGELQAAVTACLQALAVNPDAVEVLCNLGNALRVQGDLQGAMRVCRQALAINPDSPDALSNLGSACHQQGDLQTAISLYQRALSCDGNHANAHRNLSLALLLTGDYDNGLKEYEWRFQVRGCNMLYGFPRVEQWNGCNLAAREQLILVSELGLGDTLQFMRYASYLHQAGLRVALCAPTKLHGLIEASGIAATLLSPEATNQLTTGKWLPLLSVPRHLNIRPGQPLVDAPYIKVSPHLITQWQQKLAVESRPVIGINWQGNSGPGEVGDWRSLPLTSFAPVLKKTGVQFLSLQKGSGSEQLSRCPFRHRFVDCQEEIDTTWDFEETAAIIANCDLVVSSDTAVAHLAAGMGQPTWLLLTTVPEWRWGMEGETTFWYPTMRLFRQRERGNWSEVMERVARAVRALWPAPR